MKKIIMMLLGVAFAACAWAGSAAYFDPYSAIDTTPSKENAGWYSCYFLTLDNVKATTNNSIESLDMSAYATWLDHNFSSAKEAIIGGENVAALPCGDFFNGQYAGSDQNAVVPQGVNVLAVCFFDDGEHKAYMVGYHEYSSKFAEMFMDGEDPSTGWIVAPQDPIEYLTWDEETKSLVAATNTTYEVMTADTATFEDGKWYVVDSTIERAGITVNGDAHLILCDGASLTVKGGENEAGIEVPEGKSLTIYGQSEGTGKLEANGGFAAAGIGGNAKGTCGAITINGGMVKSTGGDYGAGIGGGEWNASAATITINAGEIEATGGQQGAGIGSGNYYQFGGSRSGTDVITINGGTITATGGQYGAGIGSGSDGLAATVTINGGTITASTKSAEAIGQGDDAKAATTVAFAEGAEVSIKAGDDEASATATTVADYVANHSAVYAKIVVKEPLDPIEYLTWDESTKALVAATNAEYKVVTADTATFEDGKWYVVNSTIERGAIKVNGAAHLILCDGASLKVTGADGKAGIEVPADKSLTIYGQVSGTGTLEAKGGDWAAGIGGNSQGTCGTITINGGTIKATGVEYGAGIGGGQWCKIGAMITINGGNIEAIGGRQGAGIGSGNYYKFEESRTGTDVITINGGTIKATGGEYGAGIGSGSDGFAATIEINGGTITTSTTKAEAIGSGGEAKTAATVTFGEGAELTVLAGDDEQTANEKTIAEFAADHSAQYVKISADSLVKVTKLEAEDTPADLDVAYSFMTNKVDETLLGWDANFVVSFDKKVAKDSVTLKGTYDADWTQGETHFDWQAWPMPDEILTEGVLAANTAWTLLPSDQVTYADILKIGEFKCGVRNNSADNVGTKMTVKLVLTDGTTTKEISKTEYTLAQPTVPTATVEKLSGADVPADVSAAYLFTTNHNNEVYADWNANFVVSFDNDVEKDSVTLKGAYEASWSSIVDTTWQELPMPKDLEADEEWTLLPETQVTYGDIIKFGEFKCGVRNNSKDNIGTKMTVKLVLTKDNETITISTTEYTLESPLLPKATVTKLSGEAVPGDVDAAYLFTTNVNLEVYADWEANFVVTFDKDVKKDSVALKGEYTAPYGTYDWQAIDMPGDLKANTGWTLLPEGQVTYGDVLKFGEFKCGVRNNSSENVGTKMTVELVLTKEGETITISTTTYDLEAPSVPTATVEKLSGADVPADVSAAYLFTTNHNNEVYADWNANFVVSFDSAVEKDSVTLKGAYEASWSSIVDTTWQELPMPKDLEADEEWTLLPETQVTYGDIIKFGEFKCGVRNNSADNEGTKMTVKLVLTKDNETITISTTEYELEAPIFPTAKVTKLSGEAVPGDVDAAYLFTTNINLEAYADWDANFVVTFDKDVKKDSVALKGEYTAPYGTYDWQAIDMPGDLKANTGWTLLPEGQVTYGDVLKFGEFKCGVRNNSSENVGTKMTVKLILSKDGEDSVVISTTTYDLEAPSVPTATIKTLEGTDIPADVSAAYLFTTNHNNEVYADWSANFVVSFDGAVEKDSVTLKGAYEASWSSIVDTTWQELPMPKDLEADEEWTLLPATQVTYGDIVKFGEFKCGVRNNSADNEGTKMTVKLVLTKDNETITISTTEYELEEVTLPEVTVKKLEGDDIPGDVEAAYTFTTNACVETYLDWNANFVVSFSQDIEKDSVTLKGSYEASWSDTVDTTWQAIEMPKSLGAGEEWALLPEGQVAYSDIVKFGEFKCGVCNNSFDNVGTVMTVKLILTKGERVKVLTETTYVLPEVTPPTATVDELSGLDIPYDVDVAYTYKTNDCVEAYANWYANFEVSFDKDVKKGSVVFKGEYSADWVNAGHKDYPWQDLTNFYDPFKDLQDGEIIEAGKVFNLVEEGNTTFGDLMKFVNGEFKCGVKNYSFDNEGTKMTVNLVLTDPEGNWDKRIIDTQTYTLPQITVHYASQEEVVTEGDYAYVRVYGGSKDHPVQATLSCLKKSANAIANICLIPESYPNYNQYKARFTFPDVYVADSMEGEFKRASFPITLNWSKGDDSMKVIRIKTVKTAANSANRYITLQLGHPVGAVVQNGEDLCQVLIEDNGENPPEEVTASVYPEHAGKVKGMGVLKPGKTCTLTASYAAFGKKAIYEGKKAQFVGWYKAKEGTTAIDFDNGLISDQLKLKVDEPGHYIAYFVDVLPLPQVIAMETCDEKGAFLDGVTGIIHEEVPAPDGNGLMAVYTTVVGVNVTLPIDFIDESDKGGKLTAKGLPSGLKLVYDKVTKTYSIKGKPTKATYMTATAKNKEQSNYVVATLTGSNAAGKNVLKIGFIVTPIDGTYVGNVTDNDEVVGGVSITIGKSGNVSAKVTTFTETMSFSAKEIYMEQEEVHGEMENNIVLRMTNKAGVVFEARLYLETGFRGTVGNLDFCAYGRPNFFNKKAATVATLSEDLYNGDTSVGTIKFKVMDNNLVTINAKVNGKSLSGTGGYVEKYGDYKSDFFFRSGKVSLYGMEVEFHYFSADGSIIFTGTPKVTFDNNGAATTLFIGHPID